ncbi:MAG: class I adenylate-forming enzyme family protein [Natrialbaceae archaeon]|nr:class I adenylate-forming enzyme family protein [Natrialbaceae archaeon]
MELDEVADEAKAGNVAKLFDETARHHGEALAMEHRGERWTHEELRDATATFAGGLHDIGLEPGDVMLVYMPNCPEYILSSLGSMKAGVVVSPVNPQYKTREVSYQLENTEAGAVIVHFALRNVLEKACDEAGMDPTVITVGGEGKEGDYTFDEVSGEPTLVECEEDDVSLLPYTSGTTGDPKGVQLTHGNTRAQLSMILSQPSDLEDEEIRSLIWLPLYHITGFTHTAFQPLVRGGAVFLRSALNWDAEECMELIQDEGITTFVGVTTMYVDMVESETFGEYDLTSLESAGEGGAKMSVAVQEQFEETAGIDMTEGYGLTETHGATHMQGLSTHGLKHGTIGQPLRMTDCKIVDSEGNEVPEGETGELLVRGPMVMTGYHEMPEATEEAFTDLGYFRTGDVARRDSTNYYEIVDRKKHMINTAGYNVYPSEIEEFLAEHEAISEAAIVGIPDERRNEIPIAFVVTAPDVEPGEDITEEEIKEYCLENMAEYKHPREVTFVRQLPRTTSGKIQKFKLEEQHLEGDE